MSEKIVIAVIGVMGPLIGVVGKILWDFYKNRKTNAIGQYIEMVREIYVYLELARQELGCCRSLILKAENGGGVPKAGHQIFSSIVWESTNNDTDMIRHTWNRQAIDEQYAKLLSAVYSDGSCTLKTDDMKEGILRDFYIADNIQQSQLFRVYSDNEKFIYMSFDFKEAVDLNEPAKRNIVRSILQNMQVIFEKMEKLS